jgi:hypothetical protein
MMEEFPSSVVETISKPIVESMIAFVHEMHESIEEY